ncbi:DUF4282 domain-containing protein [Litorihabitans aurantiacus]|uniref:DUF4282 domain-containing protein n=1 Tax=Litorihabitans aurantiacus TaxID=1930061 RepID=A0AA37UTE5_9MICO|nr:hypothetical protein [Litorihabitans aurantiacus]GMA30920.1 hypothetical protein GCM10025875_09120 [Litorihabitans aurantiacus]
MSQPFEPSGQQPNPWGATPAPQQGSAPQPPQQGAPAGYGQQPGFPQGQGDAQQGQQGHQGYQGAPAHQGYGAPSQIPGYGAPGGGQPQQQWSAPGQTAEPGVLARLFDVSVTKLVAPTHLRGAMVLVLIVAGGVTLQRAVSALFYFDYPDAGRILIGVLSLLLSVVYGLAVLLIGRAVIELLVHVAAIRERAGKSGSGE